jgi:ribonuclease PH
MGEMQIRVDCDVIQADGGTRTASITGGYVALHLAFRKLVDLGILSSLPLVDQVAAVSCGIYMETPVLDLDYAEDSAASVDINFVLTGRGGIVEIQGTAETAPFTEVQLSAMLVLARKGIGQLIGLQRKAIYTP